MKRKRTYVGTDEGRRCFLEWELKDGKFASSAEIWNKAGTDCESCGQMQGELLKLFPGNDQLKEMVGISDKYHLNDRNPGSPRQTKLVDEVIGPEYEMLSAKHCRIGTDKKTIKQTLLRRLKKIKYNANLSEYRMFEELMDLLPKFVAAKSRVSVMSTPKGMMPYRPSGQHYLLLSIAKKDIETLLSGFEMPDRYTYICRRLKDIGRYRDPDYLVKGKAYKYGSAWLRLDIPDDTIKKIEAWKEIQPPDELTPIQDFCQWIPHTIKSDGRGKEDDWEFNKWKLTVKDVVFYYRTGMGITETPTIESIMTALLSDGLIGSVGLDGAIDSCVGDLGYDASTAVKVARACVETYEKLEGLGIWDLELAEGVR